MYEGKQKDNKQGERKKGGSAWDSSKTRGTVAALLFCCRQSNLPVKTSAASPINASNCSNKC